MSAANTPAAPATRDACLFFRDGRLVGLEVTTDGQDGHLFTIPQLVAKSLLSITDRMILDQIAARVDKLVRQLDAS
jgi:hypothetical protein